MAGNTVTFAVAGLTTALSNEFVRITALDRTELFKGQKLTTDASGNITLDIGSAGADGQAVLIEGDNYGSAAIGSYKSFAGNGVVVGTDSMGEIYNTLEIHNTLEVHS